jgi:hypothetical protein
MFWSLLRELSDKWFHPNREKQEEIMTCLSEFKELSTVAVQLGDQAAYKNLQIEMNQMFMQYMVTVFFDSLRFLLPHFIMMWLLSINYRFINLPFAIPGLGSEIGIVVWYPVAAILAHISFKRLKKRLQAGRTSMESQAGI